MKKIIALISKNERHHKKLYFLLLLVLGFILFLPVFFQIRFHSLRSFGLLGVFLLNFLGSATVFLPSPAFISVSITATQSNPLLVAFIGALGASLGEATTFLFGLTSNKFFNLEKHKWIYKFKKNIFDKWGEVVILLFAFIPNPLFDGIGMLAGVSKFPIKRFLVLTFIGRFMRYIAIAYLAAHFIVLK